MKVCVNASAFQHSQIQLSSEVRLLFGQMIYLLKLLLAVITRLLLRQVSFKTLIICTS